MAEQIIKNPSITPDDLQIELSGGYVTAISGHPVYGTGTVTGDYYSASNPSGFINSDQAEAQILAKKYITSSVSELDNFYSKSQTSGADEIANAIKYFVTEDLLKGTSGELKTWVSTNYYGKTETSSKEALETAFGSKQDNLTQEQLAAISSVSSKLTQDKADTLYAPISVTGDVDTLKSSSGNWDKVSAKLDTTAFSTVSGNFLTAHQSLDDYVPYSATNLAIGNGNDASAYSFAQGSDNSANWNSVTFGTYSTAYSRSLAVGENAVANSHSLSIGGGPNSHGNSADGQSIAVGNGVSARNRSIAVGSHSTVADTNALSIGGYCIASGTGSVAIGFRNSAYNVFEVGGGQAFGINLEISGGLAIGYYNATKDAAFVIGNGSGNDDDTVVNRSDSFVIYRDGCVSAAGNISAKQFQNADGTETINGTTYSFTGIDNIEILPSAATANTANFPNDNVLRFILES